ncbi:MAG: hypothetical protein ACI9XP_000361 [Lentimonas sp.]|jgi:hypothetical protein
MAFIGIALGFFKKNKKSSAIKNSQIVTLFTGVFAVILVTNMQNELELMLYSYAFMVSGLLVPVIGILSEMLRIVMLRVILRRTISPRVMRMHCLAQKRSMVILLSTWITLRLSLSPFKTRVFTKKERN